MSLKTIQDMLTIKSSMQNLQMQEMSMATKAMSTISSLKRMQEDARSAPARQMLEEIQTLNNINAEMRKTNMDHLTPEQRVAIEDGLRFNEQKKAAKFLHLADPVSAAFTPASSQTGAEVQNGNLEFMITMAAEDGESIDTQDMLRQQAATNVSLAAGGDPIGTSYASIPSMSRSIIAESVPDYEPSELSIENDDLDIKRKTFRSVVVNEFQNKFANEKDMSPDDRIKEATKSAMSIMDIDPTSNPDLANAFAGEGIEAVMQYRESESMRVTKKLEGMNAMNLIAARDGLNKIGFDISSMAPSDMVNAMNSNAGFRNMMQIAEAVNLQGDDTLLFSDLAKKVSEINPLVTKDGISEFERKNIIKKNFLDVVSNRLVSANIPASQRVAMIKMVDDIDKKIDSGNVDPVMDKMLNHVYSRWVDGYSTHDQESRMQADIAAASNRGIIREIDGKVVQIDGNFEAYRRNATKNIEVAVADNYLIQAKTLPYGAGYGFVKEVAGNQDGVLNVNYSNKQFYLGSFGSNKINVGLSQLMDGVIRDIPIEKISPAFSSPEAKNTASKVSRNASIIAGNPDLAAGLFMKADGKNPIVKAGIELEKFGDYFVPESVGEMMNSNMTPEMSALKTAALKSKWGAKAIIGATLHAYQTQAQEAANVYENSMINNAAKAYDEYRPTADGYQPSIYRVALSSELGTIENDLPFLMNDLPKGGASSLNVDDMIKYREGLEKRIKRLEVGKSEADKRATEDQKALFKGTSADIMGEEYVATIDSLKEISELISDLEVMTPVGTGYYNPNFTSRSLRSYMQTQKYNELSNRLMVVRSDMRKASRM